LSKIGEEGGGKEAVSERKTEHGERGNVAEFNSFVEGRRGVFPSDMRVHGQVHLDSITPSSRLATPLVEEARKREGE